jgi:hypothetical protein
MDFDNFYNLYNEINKYCSSKYYPIFSKYEKFRNQLLHMIFNLKIYLSKFIHFNKNDFYHKEITYNNKSIKLLKLPNTASSNIGFWINKLIKCNIIILTEM